MTAEYHKRRYIRHEEDAIQKQCVGWFRSRFPGLAPLLFHVNNEAYFGGLTEEQRKAKGRRMSDMGIVAGVADIIFLHPHPSGVHGLCIEFKTPKGRQEPTQKMWQQAVEAHGFRYEIVRDEDVFVEMILDYLDEKPSFADTFALRRLEAKRKGCAKVKKGRKLND